MFDLKQSYIHYDYDTIAELKVLALDGQKNLMMAYEHEYVHTTKFRLERLNKKLWYKFKQKIYTEDEVKEMFTFSRFIYKESKIEFFEKLLDNIESGKAYSIDLDTHAFILKWASPKMKERIINNEYVI